MNSSPKNLTVKNSGLLAIHDSVLLDDTTRSQGAWMGKKKSEMRIEQSGKYKVNEKEFSLTVGDTVTIYESMGNIYINDYPVCAHTACTRTAIWALGSYGLPLCRYHKKHAKYQRMRVAIRIEGIEKVRRDRVRRKLQRLARRQEFRRRQVQQDNIRADSRVRKI